MPVESDLLLKIAEMQREITRLSNALHAVEAEARRPFVPLQEKHVLPLAPLQGWLLSMIESYMMISKLGNSPFYAADVQKLRSFINEQDFRIRVRTESKVMAGDAAHQAVNVFNRITGPFR